MKRPISLIIDDPAPVVSTFYESGMSGTSNFPSNKLYHQTKDGRPLLKTFSNDFLYQFCDIIEKWDIRGKYSVVPMPGNKGDIVNGLEGVDQAEVQQWLHTVKERVAPRFSICPEMLSHNLAVDVDTGKPLQISEWVWAAEQDRTTLTPYIAKAFTLLKEAGLESFGVTSPVNFGIQCEEEYAAAISLAAQQVTGRKHAWYFLRGLRETPNAKPWVQLEEDGRVLVSIPATTSDVIWQTMDTTQTSDEYVSEIADLLITADGSAGQIVDVVNTNGYPILITHWHSLISNGLGTGLRVLDEVARRVQKHYADTLEWMSFEEILDLVASDKGAYLKPDFI
jgi:hypothetical protein